MTTDIRDALSQAVEYLREHRSEAKYTDSAATAVLEDGLRVTVTGPEGAQLTTDMPKSIGGRGDLPSPGWFLRAAQASCLAGLIAMEAARAGSRFAGSRSSLIANRTTTGSWASTSPFRPAPSAPQRECASQRKVRQTYVLL